MKYVLMTAKHLDAGGIETFIVGIYPFIDSSRYHIDFLITKKEQENDPRGYFEETLIQQGAKVYRISSKSRHPLKAYKELKFFFKVHKEYEIFHINDGGGAAFPLYIALKAGIKKVIVHSHNSKSIYWKQNFIMKIARSFLITNAKCIGCSIEAAKWMFGDRASYEVLHYGIDTKLFQYNEKNRAKIRNNFNISKSDIVIGHVGRFSKQKNHSFLIEIFYELYKKNQNCKLMLIGSGELEGVISRKVSTLDLNKNVIFVGNTKNVEEFLSAMDVFVFPSFFEGFAIAHIEAQCNGLPCIISNTINDECKITDLVKMLSLDDKAVDWADIIWNIIQTINVDNRKEYAEIVAKMGFDRKETAFNLMEIYEALSS